MIFNIARDVLYGGALVRSFGRLLYKKSTWLLVATGYVTAGS